MVMVIIMNLKIRNIREDNDLSQKDVAQYLRCDQSLYSKYERGIREVPLYVVVKLAKLYNTSIDYLVGLTNNKEPYPTEEKRS